MYGIEVIRKEWYYAYYSGNTEQLDYIEADDFRVITNGKSFDKRRQLINIQALVDQGKWFSPNVSIREEHVKRFDLHQITAIYGESSVYDNSYLLSAGKFIEIWVVDKGRWRVSLLGYEVDANPTA